MTNSTKPAPLAAEADDGRAFEIDHKKLGPEGHQRVGYVNALAAWVARFSTMRARSGIAQERVFLAEIISCLESDRDHHAAELVRYAMARGAGKAHTSEGVPPADLTSDGPEPGERKN